MTVSAVPSLELALVVPAVAAAVRKRVERPLGAVEALSGRGWWAGGAREKNVAGTLWTDPFRDLQGCAERDLGPERYVERTA